ncbi:hypothetical protein L1D14_03935 [Vibrio tubiashii]|uniref:hypothetical protein n=1 Tax=Vibrio tubiashii TaxID=29498 RepID=UPI001EFECF21|nr:hypothetical protein [Vibrio tubiashii]MCG9575381.1 hypothetical protein [Vibrio tubiashii]
MTNATSPKSNTHFIAGQFDSFVDQEARSYVSDRFSSSTSDEPTNAIANELVSIMRSDPNNFTSKLFNDHHLDRANLSHDRFLDVAAKSVHAERSMNYVSDNAELQRTQANWDFSNAVNRHLASIVTDYLMTSGSAEPDVSRMSEVVEAYITKPLEQQHAIQQSLPAHLVALHELKDSLDKNLSGDFASRYGNALSTDSFNKDALEFIEKDATAQGIEVPTEYTHLKQCLSEFHESVGVADSLVLPSTQRELSALFEREGVDVSNPELSKAVEQFIKDSAPRVSESVRIDVQPSSPFQH